MELSLCINLCGYNQQQQRSFPLRILVRDPARLVAVVPVVGRRQYRTGVAAKCVKLTAKMAAEEAEEEEEWMKAARLENKCGDGGGGVAEMLECLEKEAIMGDDHGREPRDYNRRAQIFDKSSRVFQALKDHTPTTSNTASSNCT